MEKQKTDYKLKKVLATFKINSRKLEKFRKVLIFMDERQKENLKHFYKIISDGLAKKILLTRFKKAIAVKKILDKQENKALKRYFNLMKKK